MSDLLKILLKRREERDKVNPIDLQTNFSQLGQVGKIQANAKDGQDLKESQINSNVQSQSNQEAEDVPVTKDISEGPGKIKDDEKEKEKQKKRELEEQNREEEKKKEDEEHEKNKKNLQNPKIGSNIDILL